MAEVLTKWDGGKKQAQPPKKEKVIDEVYSWGRRKGGNMTKIRP